MSQSKCCCVYDFSIAGSESCVDFLLSPIEQFEIMPLISIYLGWFDVSVTNQTVALFVIFSALLSLRTGLTSYLDDTHLVVPIRFQYILEKYLKGLLLLTHERISRIEGSSFFPIITTLSFYMICLNITGLIPHTAALLSHVAVTITISGSFFIGMNIICVERFGIKFFTLLLPPNTPIGVALILVPVECLSFFCRPLSLATRLFANSMGGHTLVKIVAGCAWGFVNCSCYSYVCHGAAVLIMIPLMILETSVALIQSAVFVNLICIYIGEGLSL